MIAYTFLVVLTLVVAYLEKRDDHAAIKAHIAINHKAQVFERMLMLGLLVVMVAVGSSIQDWTWRWTWNNLLFAPISWAVFTVSFRWMLNKARGMDWRYVSPSNKYDFFFFWIGSRPGMGLYFGALFDPKTRKAISDIWVSKGYHAGWQPWIIWSHRGGTIAYLFELSILALSTWGYFHFTNQ